MTIDTNQLKGKQIIDLINLIFIHLNFSIMDALNDIKSYEKVTGSHKSLLVKVAELPKYKGRGMSGNNDTPGDLND